ncbi:RagB/SusD family nutrient uptake outer membrane protein [Pedobacter gandavensis]|uniref:RagB/SusD family nutrient uptake outer membrane protein n=1 Tax=Pedobacter gandavensis TaxID=2679963 RepID=UPI00292EB82C|nr:RagB/SusD family nutrient uptake outer membrane protein [Pedobacter gandavensis]
MKKSLINTCLFAGLALMMALSSCSKWLDVQPEDKFTEKQIFSSLEGISDAINGVYLDMGKTKLYGATLTSAHLEIFAQRYNVPSVHNYTRYQTYNYEDKVVKASLDLIWTDMYRNVLNVNKFIKNLDAYPGVLDAKADSIFRGEAYGLRAFLQFDLLRMYGPRYSSVDSLRTSIPYYTDAGTNVNEISPANIVMQKIVLDLKKAEALLAADPVRKQGVLKVAEQPYLQFRNYRMNYFALKALQARVYLYRGDQVSAAAAAQVVINNSEKFPWIENKNIMSDKQNPDRVFSTEILFGLQSIDMYSNYRTFFSADQQTLQILAPGENNLKTLFENNENDYRYNPNWMMTGIGGKSFKTFFKYADIDNKALVYRMTMPLIRLSEVYYIAAEAGKNVEYLNKVRNQRGLLNLLPTANFDTELLKEYQKEFFGEGQLWFYYKRKNATSIPNPLVASGNLTMNLSNYVFPLPLSELNPR